ncbi:MAG: hypothetical protein HC848_06055 [Limnobacter sp.]|nr:hypothetical protein [Limnobacter sp.]
MVYALGFILVLYLMAPWLAVVLKAVVYSQLVGLNYQDLPNWVAAWGRVSEGLAWVDDVNADSVVQFAEIGLSSDILVLISPEIAAIPFFLSGLIAVGGLAAALSTADGLLLAISNSVAHDFYYKTLEPGATAQKRVTMSKIVLLSVALLAAWVTSLKPGNIVYLVSAAFALAGSTLFVPLVAGVFWPRATRTGAVWAILVGFVSSASYLLATNPSVTHFFGLAPAQWLPVEAVGSGLFTIPLGALAMVVGSALSKPDPGTQAVVHVLQNPEKLQAGMAPP